MATNIARQAYGLKGGDFEFPTKHFFFAGKDFQPLELEQVRGGTHLRRSLLVNLITGT